MTLSSPPHRVEHAAAVLRGGGLVAFPTETVYGLGADASNPEALAKIFALKGRPADHPLIVHIEGPDRLDAWAREVPADALRLAERCWPGPLTLVLRKHARVPDLVTGRQDTVALRVPGHPLALALLRSFDGGLAAPSANRFGRISPTQAEHVREEFGAQCPLVLDGGPCTVGLESTILDLSGGIPRVLRPGGVAVSTLAAVLGRPVDEAGGGAPRVPGAHEVHYAPASGAVVCGAADLREAVAAHMRAGRRVAAMPIGPAPPGAEAVPMPDDAVEYARGLYAALRALDRRQPACIYIEAPPQGEAWQAVWDRLRRAARVQTQTSGGKGS